MQNLFPNCPICRSSKGYGLSVYYPRICCKFCEAEWILSEDGMALRKITRMGWDFELLNKTYPISFWKEWKGPQIVEKVYSPMDYKGGHTDYKDPAVGHIILRPDGLEYETTGASLHQMNIVIPLEKLRRLEVRTSKEITFYRWWLMGAWSILFKKKYEYLVLTYEDDFNMEQHVVLDFHGRRELVDELTSLVSYLKKKKAQTI
jgi:hypothetical protein